MRRYLEQQNVRVLPEGRLPFSGLQEAVDQALGAAELFVQLLDADSGQGIPLFQHERAVVAGLPVMHWRPRDLDWAKVSEKAHRELLAGDTVIVSTLVDFQAMIRKCLFEPPPPG